MDTQLLILVIEDFQVWERNATHNQLILCVSVDDILL